MHRENTAKRHASDWLASVNAMHQKFGFFEKIIDLTPGQMAQLLQFRVNFIEEEFTELQDNLKIGNAEEIVDALIDICVVAIGTLDLFDVDADKAWSVVEQANMAKQAGVNPSRPNPLGLPDLMKPEGWKAPSHEHNHGRLTEIDYSVLGSSDD
jgi:hypothetical protein